MAVEHLTDHVERAGKRLISHLRKPTTLAIVASFVRQDQRLIDAAHEVATSINLTNGFGVILDMIGSLVQWGRRDLDDEDYRRGLRACIRARNSKGRADDIRDVTSLYLDGTLTNRDFVLRRTPPGAMILEGSTDGFDVEGLFLLLKMAIAPGIRLDFAVSYVDPTPADSTEALFGWEDQVPWAADPDGELHGAGWEDDPAIGGTLAWDRTITA